MKITVLTDNISKNELAKEWGLSIHIEYEGKNILLDTGKSGIFVKNAAALGIDLEAVDAGVLSHAHYDHFDGIEEFFALNKKAGFHIRKCVEENCYHKYTFSKKYIGVKRGVLEKYADRFVKDDGDVTLFDGVMLIPHKTSRLDTIGRKAHMYIVKNGRTIPDDFSHEQSLVFDSEKGLVIFNSCSHGGADNIINEIKSTFPDKEIYALIGGFHLFGSSPKAVKRLAVNIKATGIKRIITGHCTGERAFNILKEELGSSVEQMYTGMSFEI